MTGLIYEVRGKEGLPGKDFKGVAPDPPRVSRKKGLSVILCRVAQ